MLIFKARNVCIVQNTRQNQKPDKIWFCGWIALNMCVCGKTHMTLPFLHSITKTSNLVLWCKTIAMWAVQYISALDHGELLNA